MREKFRRVRRRREGARQRSDGFWRRAHAQWSRDQSAVVVQSVNRDEGKQRGGQGDGGRFKGPSASTDAGSSGYKYFKPTQIKINKFFKKNQNHGVFI